MEFQSFEAKKITPHVGANISGIDLTRPLNPQQVEDVEKALSIYGVLRFEGQALEHESLKQLGRQFGKLHFHTGVKSMTEHPEITEIYSDANSKHVNGEVWHSDLSCDPIPPMGSILHMSISPDAGGDTAFSSSYAAYDALSERMKVYLEGLTATHDGHFAFSRFNPDGKFTRASHPVINTHPVSGRKGIYVNRGFTSHMDDMPYEEGKALLEFLYDHCERAEWSMRFRWAKDVVAFWDNRCVQHLAVWDYYPEVRSGIRVQIAANDPIS